ncbi:MAG: mannose-1-phosphate guanylyltransferase/mannose-6-phosphate isomerase [Alphaproteobacteria bacterium]|nr:mannose-1-phosphate guanylyltransferase/mannose-6-phosphate isomerase [Alphaproteobacteria bacterium]
MTPVVLSGGAGTRLWPVSRRAYPKQLLALTGDRSLFQETLRRVDDPAAFAPPLVVCGEEHRFLIAEQARALGIAPRAILLEPAARNTAPAAACAALTLAETLAQSDPQALMLVLPSDHVIADMAAFRAAIARGRAAAAGGALVAFAVKARSAETGYGWIQEGPARPDGARAIARFVEKPDRARAEAMLAAGDHHWNAGIFLCTAAAYLAELQKRQPDVVAACRAALAKARRDLDFVRLDGEAFKASPAISIDYAVMEHAADRALVPVDMGWSDVGSWTALWEIAARDGAGNAVIGSVVAADARDCYLRAESRLLAVAGVADLVVVETADAVLVTTRDRAQDVKPLVDALRAAKRPEADEHPRVWRPWGYYQEIDAGTRFKVKHMMVQPGQRLSLQLHHKRAEHWVVVQGTAKVTRGEETFVLQENEGVFIPLGAKHRLENPGAAPLHLIEVQSGLYLGEDDIVRLQDDYNRS